MFGVGKIGLWSVIEEAVGITAASIPALKPLLTLRIFGFSHSDPNSATNLKSTPIKTQRKVPRDAYSMDTFVELGDGGDSQRDDDDGDSQKRINMQGTNIMVTTLNTVVTENKTPQQVGWPRSQALGWSEEGKR